MENSLKNKIMSHFKDVIDVKNLKDNLYLLDHGFNYSFCIFNKEPMVRTPFFQSYKKLNEDIYIAEDCNEFFFFNAKTLWVSSYIIDQKEIAPGVYICKNPKSRHDRKLISPVKCLEQEKWSTYPYPDESDVSNGFVFLLKEERFDTSLVLVRLSDLKESGPISFEFNRKVEYLGNDFMMLSYRRNPKVKALINKNNLAACKIYAVYDSFKKLDDKICTFNFANDWSLSVEVETMEASSFIKNKAPFRDGLSIAETNHGCHVIIRDCDNMESPHFTSYKELTSNILRLKRKEDSEDITLFNLNTFAKEGPIFNLRKVTEKLYSTGGEGNMDLINIETFEKIKLFQTVKCELENGIITCYSKAGSKSTLNEKMEQSAFQF